MLSWIVTRAVTYPRMVVSLCALFLIVALSRIFGIEMDVFPEFAPAQLSIQTEAPGFSPEQVESLVTSVIESNVSGVGHQSMLRSESLFGLSVITILFSDDTDVTRARQLLSERLADVTNRLPLGVRSPKLAPLTSSTADLLKIGITSEVLNPAELREFAEFTVKPTLTSVPGVAKCSVFGGEVRQLQILLDKDKLAHFGIAALDVIAAARASSGIRGLGTVAMGSQDLMVTARGQALSPEQMGRSLVAIRSVPGRYMRLDQVATVRFGPAVAIGDAIINGKPGVLFSLASQYGSNTLANTQRVEAALEGLQSSFKKNGIQVSAALHRPASFIEHSLAHIGETLVIGGVLVSCVLLVFLGDVRSGIVSLIAIPLSLLGSIMGLGLLGYTLNTLSIGGLAIAIGEVVDDAIIDVENIYRRVRENTLRSSPLSLESVVQQASIEIRSSVVYATGVVVVVFIPVLQLSGVVGNFFRPLALSYILAICASLLVAVSCTPALTLLTLRIPKDGGFHARCIASLQGVYAKLLQFLARYAKWVYLTALGWLVTCIYLVPHGEVTLLPDFQEGHLVVQMRAAPGVALTEMRRMGSLLSRDLLKLPAVASVEEQIGRAELSEDTWGVNRAEFHVELKETTQQEPAAIVAAVREVFSAYPGVDVQVLSFLGDRMSETITGETSPLVVRLRGNDLDQLDLKAGVLAERLKSLPELLDVAQKNPAGSPLLSVDLSFGALAASGVPAIDVLDTLQAAYQGVQVGDIYRGTLRNGVAVLFDPEHPILPEQLGTVMIRSLRGNQVPLREVADISVGRGRGAILHEDQRRTQTVTARFNGPASARVVSQVSDIANRVVADAPDMSVTVLDMSSVASASSARLVVEFLGVAVGLGLLLAVALKSMRRALLILVNAPFSCIGGIVGLRLYAVAFGEGQPLWTIGTLIGFITLFGMTMRTSIMLLTHYEQLAREQGGWSSEVMLHGAADRLVPILMTATVTGLGLLPLALTPHLAGHELEGSMAWVIIGGLVSSTVLSLTVLPLLSQWCFSAGSPADKDRAEPTSARPNVLL